MPAKSKAQQKFMGMVHGLQKGTVKPSSVSGKVKKVAKDMGKKDAEDFASTKHKGKPEHVKENLRRLIQQEIRASVGEASNFRAKVDAYTNAMDNLDKYFLQLAAVPAPKKAKTVSKIMTMLQRAFLSKDESVTERVAHPFSQHLRKAQEEVEWMVSKGPNPDGDDVYDNPKQSIKFLQVAQKALSRIT